jgi:hypothetical protein
MAADTNASLAGDLGITAYLNLQFFDLLHETRDLKEVCTYVPFTAGAGSATQKLRFIQPVDPMTQPGEITAPAITNWTTANKTITVAKSNLYRSGSDLAYITGVIQADNLVMSFLKSVVYHRSSLIAALGSGFTANTAVGSTGVALTVDTVYAGLFALRKALVEGQIDLVTHATGITQFMASLRGETATPLQIAPETQGALSNDGSGNIQFSWMGVNFRSHASVPKINPGNVDYSGFMSSPRAIAFTEAPVANFLSRQSFNPQTVAGETAIICQDLSTESIGARSYICHYYPGVAEMEDARGVQVVSAV